MKYVVEMHASSRGLGREGCHEIHGPYLTQPAAQRAMDAWTLELKGRGTTASTSACTCCTRRMNPWTRSGSRLSCRRPTCCSAQASFLIIPEKEQP